MPRVIRTAIRVETTDNSRTMAPSTGKSACREGCFEKWTQLFPMCSAKSTAGKGLQTVVYVRFIQFYNRFMRECSGVKAASQPGGQGKYWPKRLPIDRH